MNDYAIGDVMRNCDLAYNGAAFDVFVDGAIAADR